MNYLKHFNLVNKHRWYVFKLCVKAGIPFRGLVHDLSKYSLEEFFESAKYYNGSKSPIHYARKDNGYSKAWLHHKGRNKHHFEYWEDINDGKRTGVFVPYKYIVESVCDKIAAGMAYLGDDWYMSEPLEYWNKKIKNNAVVKHKGSVEFTDIVLGKLADSSIDEALNPKYLKSVYKKVSDKYHINR